MLTVNQFVSMLRMMKKMAGDDFAYSNCLMFVIGSDEFEQASA